MKWLLRAALLAAILYGVLFGTVLTAMHQTPERFSAFMKRIPPVLVWGGLPARRMWLHARSGALAAGDPAPDFNLRTATDRNQRIALSSYGGQRPVVLVFGSYT
jgi:hypothetical protein